MDLNTFPFTICIRIRSIGLLHLKKVRTLGRASPAEGQRFSVTGKGDISKLEKWVTFLFCVDTENLFFWINREEKFSDGNARDITVTGFPFTAIDNETLSFGILLFKSN